MIVQGKVVNKPAVGEPTYSRTILKKTKPKKKGKRDSIYPLTEFPGR